MEIEKAVEVLIKLKEMILHEDQFDVNITISEGLVIAEAIDVAIINMHISEAFVSHFIKKP
jgi:hypothetical protein